MCGHLHGILDRPPWQVSAREFDLRVGRDRLRAHRLEVAPFEGVAALAAAALDAALNQPTRCALVPCVKVSERRFRAPCAAACRRRSAPPRSGPFRCRRDRAPACSFCNGWPTRRRAVGLQLDAPLSALAWPRRRAGAAHRPSALCRAGLTHGARPRGDHVRLREPTRSAELVPRACRRAPVDVDLLVVRAVERTTPRRPGRSRRQLPLTRGRASAAGSSGPIREVGPDDLGLRRIARRSGLGVVAGGAGAGAGPCCCCTTWPPPLPPPSAEKGHGVDAEDPARR